jgi:hypothetical protein
MNKKRKQKCYHCTQQKDAGETWEMRFHKLPENVILEKNHLGYESYRLWFSGIQRFIDDELNKVATQARQQAFQECLEAVGNEEDEDKLKIPVGSSLFYSSERIRYEVVAIQNRNATRKKIRANIEKLKKGA